MITGQWVPQTHTVCSQFPCIQIRRQLPSLPDSAGSSCRQNSSPSHGYAGFSPRCPVRQIQCCDAPQIHIWFLPSQNTRGFPCQYGASAEGMHRLSSWSDFSPAVSVPLALSVLFFPLSVLFLQTAVLYRLLPLFFLSPAFFPVQ